MHQKWTSWRLATLAVFVLTPVVGSDSAPLPVGELGILTCTVERPASASPAPSAKGREAICEFRPRDSAPSETYVATLQFIGQDGKTGAESIMLVVKAPHSTKLVPGVLEQTYAADASTGTEASRSGAKGVPLLGEKNGALVLQPEPNAEGEASLALGQPRPGILIRVELTLRSSPG
jgi:uncharacterized protein DUF992